MSFANGILKPNQREISDEWSDFSDSTVEWSYVWNTLLTRFRWLYILMKIRLLYYQHHSSENELQLVLLSFLSNWSNISNPRSR